MNSELEELQKELAELDIKAKCVDCFKNLESVLTRALEVKKRIKEIKNLKK